MQCYILKMGGNFEPSGTTTSPEYNNFFRVFPRQRTVQSLWMQAFWFPSHFRALKKNGRRGLLFCLLRKVVLSDPSLPYVTFRRET